MTKPYFQVCHASQGLTNWSPCCKARSPLGLKHMSLLGSDLAAQIQMNSIVVFPGLNSPDTWKHMLSCVSQPSLVTTCVLWLLTTLLFNSKKQYSSFPWAQFAKHVKAYAVVCISGVFIAYQCPFACCLPISSDCRPSLAPYPDQLCQQPVPSIMSVPKTLPGTLMT